VTVFESAPSPGGLLTYGIPNFKLPKSVVDARLEDLRRAGIEFVTGVRIGKDQSLDSLLQDGFDAVFVGVGSGIDADMEIPGDDLPGVYQATEFLIRCNVEAARLPAGLQERRSESGWW
jgi:glutamate synthase (NADPH/NADH) small chain